MIRPAAVSARKRLRHYATARGEDFQHVLTRYTLERLLYRLSISEHADDFVLKGAMLFALWSDVLEHRPTKDIDLLGRGDPHPERLADVFRTICRLDLAEDDGLNFHGETVIAQPIRADAIYDGVRVVLRATLGKARVRVQIDVGFGDAVTPSPVRVCYPTLIGDAAPKLAAYPAVTVVAEKLEAMVSLGLANSRMKDFYDVRWCAQHLSFNGDELVRAITATFDRRGTTFGPATPLALTDEFATDTTKQVQWSAFARKTQLVDLDLTLQGVITLIGTFLLPAITHCRAGGDPGRWEPGGPWERERR